MFEQKRPSDATIGKMMQEDVNRISSSELEHQARIINTLNAQSAKNRWGLYLRLPQPNPCGHGLYTTHTWTEAEATTYSSTGKLPRDLSSVNLSATCLILWIFDARGCGGRLPEVEFEDASAMPDFEKKPAMCAFDMDGREWVALIPSEFLRMVLVGERKVRFELNEKGLGDGGSAGETAGNDKAQGGSSEGTDEEKKGDGEEMGEKADEKDEKDKADA